jgi:Co/Zn/Cd efflux system component
MSRTQRLIVVLVLNLGLVAGVVAVGVTAHSIAVLAEGGDYLLDAAGVAVALLAIWLAARPATRTRALIRKVLTRLRPRVDGAGGRSCRG